MNGSVPSAPCRGVVVGLGTFGSIIIINGFPWLKYSFRLIATFYAKILDISQKNLIDTRRHFPDTDVYLKKKISVISDIQVFFFFFQKTAVIQFVQQNSIAIRDWQRF